MRYFCAICLTQLQNKAFDIQILLLNNIEENKLNSKKIMISLIPFLCLAALAGFTCFSKYMVQNSVDYSGGTFEWGDALIHILFGFFSMYDMSNTLKAKNALGF